MVHRIRNPLPPRRGATDIGSATPVSVMPACDDGLGLVYTDMWWLSLRGARVYHESSAAGALDGHACPARPPGRGGSRSYGVD